MLHIYKGFLQIIIAATLVIFIIPVTLLYALELKSSSLNASSHNIAQGIIKSTTSLGQALSGNTTSNSYQLKIGFIPTIQFTHILSISVNPKSWDIGLTQVNQTITMTQPNKITVTNDGTGKETYTLSLINPQGWTASNTADRDSYVLIGLFCNVNDIPQINSFNQDAPQLDDDIISTQTRQATPAVFGYSASTASGALVPKGESRSLYLQFKSPTTTDKTQEQSISVIISCQTP